jgi:hypothetical protein
MQVKLCLLKKYLHPDLHRDPCTGRFVFRWKIVLPFPETQFQRMGYALLAELTDLDLQCKSLPVAELLDTRVSPCFLKCQRETHGDLCRYQVVVDRAGFRLHLCADTLTALTAFVGHLVSAFQPPAETYAPY